MSCCFPLAIGLNGDARIIDFMAWTGRCWQSADPTSKQKPGSQVLCRRVRACAYAARWQGSLLSQSELVRFSSCPTTDGFLSCSAWVLELVLWVGHLCFRHSFPFVTVSLGTPLPSPSPSQSLFTPPSTIHSDPDPSPLLLPLVFTILGHFADGWFSVLYTKSAT